MYVMAISALNAIVNICDQRIWVGLSVCDNMMLIESACAQLQVEQKVYIISDV